MRDRLRAAGYAPTTFRYHSMHVSMRDTAGALAACLRTLGDEVHVIAHSLGGLVTCETFTAHSALPFGRIVLLGAPVRGSRTARAVATHWYGPALLGPFAVAELARVREQTPEIPREVGVIAGTRSIGAGRLFSELPCPNDGTVCLDETGLPGARAQSEIDVSHTGMLFSRDVADAAVCFLRYGRFPHKGA